MWAAVALSWSWLLVASPAAPPQQARSDARGLAGSLPPGLPDLSTWERSSGHAEFDAPRRTVDYELYIDPARGGSYAVTRYRIRVFDLEERERVGITDTEKLQWDIDGRQLRRWECRPESAAASSCRWVELASGSEAFHQELRPILVVYAVHRQLLYEREDQGAR